MRIPKTSTTPVMCRVIRYTVLCALLCCNLLLFAQRDTAKTNAQIRGLYESGRDQVDIGNIDSAGIYFQQGYDLALRHRERFLTANGLYHLSYFNERKHNLSDALENLAEAIAIFDELGAKRNVGNCYNSNSRIYQALGNFSLALSNGYNALRIKEDLNDGTGIAIALTSIGNIYLLTDRYDDAIAAFTRAYSIDSVNNDLDGLLGGLLNIGVAYQKKGDHEKALKKFRESLVMARQMKSISDEALLLGNIGSAFRQLGNTDSALANQLAALKLKRENNIRQAHTLNDIAKTYLQRGDAATAKNYALEAIAASEKEKNLNQLGFAWDNLAIAHEKLGNFKEAYEASEKNAIYKDSIVTIEKEKQMNELQVQYDTEKKQQTIDLLTKEKEAANFRRNAYLVGGILISAVLLLLYNRQRLNTRKNRQMYEKGMEIEKMKSAFFSNISHEFRTPLTLILGPTQSMRENTDDPKMQGQLTTMEKNARRLLSLIDQLLDLSKLESGNLKPRFSKIDIVPLARGVTMTFASMAASKHIKLEVEASPPHMELFADTEMVETVLINLLSNAFKFTPEKGSITVKLRVNEQNNQQYCRVSVQDSGIGIPEKDIPHVFDRFYQGHEGARAQSGGSGIGLALAKELVQLHKGQIDASSRPGEGTTVSFMLPLSNEHINMEEPVQTKIEAPAPLGAIPVAVETNHDGPVILLIEDNEDVMLYLKDILHEQYAILEAKDGQAGIGMAIETIPDLVISDVMMPKKDGYEVCENLKQDERTSHIPLILLTARAAFEDKMQGLENKADEYLTKPFSPKELLLRVANLIQSRLALREKYSKELVLKPTGITVTSMEEAFLQKLMRVVEDRMADDGFSIEQLSREVGLSRSQLHRKLHALTNKSATEFIRDYRLTRAMDMIRQNAGSISEIAYWVGFSSPSYFSKVFLEQYGVTPGQARANSN